MIKNNPIFELGDRILHIESKKIFLTLKEEIKISISIANTVFNSILYIFLFFAAYEQILFLFYNEWDINRPILFKNITFTTTFKMQWHGKILVLPQAILVDWRSILLLFFSLLLLPLSLTFLMLFFTFFLYLQSYHPLWEHLF